MNKKIKEVEAQLIAAKYPAVDDTPIVGANDTQDEVEVPTTKGGSYNYLTRMPINQLTFEKKQALEREAHDIKMKIDKLTATTIHHIWRQELEEFSQAWESHKTTMEASYKADRENKLPVTATKKGRGKK